MKIVSWNLFYRGGATVGDVAEIITRLRPDVFLVQEATKDIESLCDLTGGSYCTLPWKGKSYALGAWVPNGTLVTSGLKLPFSKAPGKFPPRAAQVLEFNTLTIVNVHLSHGQLLNRRQLRKIAHSIDGPLAIIGDFNTLGPVLMRGFKDVGPRQSTHRAKNVLPFRLDRCVVRDLTCEQAETLNPGRSDHRPISLKLRG